MDREPLLTEAVYDEPTESGGITLYPFTPYMLRLIDKHRINVEDATPGESLDLVYMFTHDPRQMRKIDKAKWSDAVDDFAMKLTLEQLNEVSEHANNKFAELEATSTTSAAEGKD